MHQLTVNGRPIEAADHEPLSDALRRAGIVVPLPCGGRGSCGKCRVTVNGKEELACQYRVTADAAVTVPEKETILSETGAAETGEVSGRMALALDLGTTTLALALVSQEDGGIVRVVTDANPQRAYGADVMSRIGHCRAHGPTGLQLAAVTAVNRLIRTLNAPPAETMFVAGNTAMLHLFFGTDCSAMGAAPYTPAFLASQTAPASLLGITGVETVVSLPCAAAFVGADLTAGLRYVGLPPEGKYSLLIDLGTNAEVVLFSRAGALCTAAAAGPCFEGANISCGMSATPGAIFAYAPGFVQTVRGAPAKGVCGTGLVDIVAALLADGTIDETGYMECEEFEVVPGVTLTQSDIRQYQLAKSAVCAAVLTLLQKQNVPFEEIDKLYIAGGFAAKINVGSAVATGLLPAELRAKCVAVGNSSLLGTAKFACDPTGLSGFVEKMQYVDLAADPAFSDLFIEKMTFEDQKPFSGEKTLDKTSTL
ncbi:MAG: DUF4445 domain-containing protein [Clostridia bacterium]|nr:DUF4445 domain-containing protein [Clostridia bacterium]